MNSDMNFVGYLYIMDLINAQKMEHIKIHIFTFKKASYITIAWLSYFIHMYAFHANIYNYTAINLGIC
jgi:hypothetical protein